MVRFRYNWFRSRQTADIRPDALSEKDTEFENATGWNQRRLGSHTGKRVPHEVHSQLKEAETLVEGLQ